jgi:hypothetical protein
MKVKLNCIVWSLLALLWPSSLGAQLPLVYDKENIPQTERLIKLNQIAIQQMKVLHEVENRKLLKGNSNE